jgi:predicted GNAT family N-acyltransferase
MTVQEIPHDSERYRQSLELRDQHLRQPLGLHLTADDIEGEATDRHFALLEEETIVGGLIARPASHQTIRFRQMWIDLAHIGHGHGRSLLHAVESILAKEAATSFVLHARESARGFYSKCGYYELGDPFLEIGIPHLRMEKSVV